MTRRALIIGLDGASWTVLKPAIENGHMPFLKSLVNCGTSGILESTLPAITPAAWGTFQTGRNPAQNGVFDFTSWNKYTRDSTISCSVNLKPTIWQILSENKQLVASINVPMTYPPLPVNGYVVSGLLTPSVESNFTYPPELKAEVLTHFPDYRILNLKTIPQECKKSSELQSFINTLTDLTETQTNLACYLLKKRKWNLFMYHFQVTDVLQHALWQYLDPSHPDFDVEKQTFLFESFYKVLDGQIKKLVDCYNEIFPESIIMIASDHGFESHFKSFNIANWLAQERYQILNHRLKRTITAKACGLLRYIPVEVIQALRSSLNANNQLVNYRKTQVVCCGGCKEGLAYILENDPHKKSKIENEIIEKLLTVIDPATHRPIIKNIYKTTELYSVPESPTLPDLIIEPEDGYSIRPDYRHNISLITPVTPDDIMNIGKHHKDGIFVMAGKDIRRNSSLRIRLIDVVPTLLYYFSVQSPKLLEGRICLDLFEKSFIDQTPVLQPTNVGNKTNTFHDNVYSDHDIELIRKRLEDLGYI